MDYYFSDDIAIKSMISDAEIAMGMSILEVLQSYRTKMELAEAIVNYHKDLGNRILDFSNYPVQHNLLVYLVTKELENIVLGKF